MVILDFFYMLDYIWKGLLRFADLPAIPHVPTILCGSPLFL